MLSGTEPDVIRVDAEKTATHVRFRVFLADSVDIDSAALVIAMDTDQNPETGGSAQTDPFGVFDIGAEFDVIAVLPAIEPPGAPAFPPGTIFIFVGNNPVAAPTVISNAMSSDSNMIEFSVPLTAIGGDDGNMDVAGFSIHVNRQAVATSLDLFPNSGHGSVGQNPFGDPSWLSVSPVEGQLTDGQSSTIEVTFVTDTLVDDTIYTAVLLVESVDPNNPQIGIPVILTIGDPPTGVFDEIGAKPASYMLWQNYPNPFNPSTIISYSLPVSGDVKLIIYNILGEEVIRLVDRFQSEGIHNTTWEASGVSTGIYFYRLQVGDFTQTRKMVLLK